MTGGAATDNISVMEQEFQPTAGTAVIDRGAQLLALVLEADAPRGLTDLARTPAFRRARRRDCSERARAQRPRGAAGRAAGASAPAPWCSASPAASPGRNLVELAAAAHGRARRRHGRDDQPRRARAAAASSTSSQVESRHFLGTASGSGRRVPYHCSAVGKVLLAFDAVRTPLDGPLEPLTSRTIVDPARLRSELEHRPPRRLRRRDRRARARAVGRGRARVRREGRRGGRAQRVRARRCASTPQRIAELRPLVIKQCRALSRELGHRPEGVHAA